MTATKGLLRRFGPRRASRGAGGIIGAGWTDEFRVPGRQRHEGFLASMSDADLAGDALCHPGGFDFEAGHAATMRLIARRPLPDAILAANDEAAVGALNALRQAGIDVPGEISVAGIDDLRRPSSPGSPRSACRCTRWAPWPPPHRVRPGRGRRHDDDPEPPPRPEGDHRPPVRSAPARRSRVAGRVRPRTCGDAGPHGRQDQACARSRSSTSWRATSMIMSSWPPT
ncbi:substrate-binding domain-containing protein [Nonomuraea angiospora]|uniref:substrate-binding domain-containing protein n=1 Tax=Nonomuraea angiospora TaxID=46172 RepID=UPI0034248A4F